MVEGLLSNKWNPQNSLFVVWLGYNDVSFLKENKNYKVEINEIINNLFDNLNDLYKIGAKNILIMNVLPKYLSPWPNKHHLRRNLLYFNKKLIISSRKIFLNHSDLNIIFYDIYKKISHVIKNCNEYGFKYCRKSNKNLNKINGYLWTGLHLTVSGNKIIVNDIDKYLNSINN